MSSQVFIAGAIRVETTRSKLEGVNIITRCGKLKNWSTLNMSSAADVVSTVVSGGISEGWWALTESGNAEISSS